MPFDSLGLSPELTNAVSALGYTEPTPIQTEPIPLVLEGRDVVGCAQTGTVKTAAFVLPAFQRVPAEGVLRILVVSPTREPAQQIEAFAAAVSSHTGHAVTSALGGVPIEPQVKALNRGVDLLVATPGRLLDLVNRKAADLSKVEILVLDEADRMLDMGFWPDVRRILAQLPAKRQTLLFSATMAPDVLRVVHKTLNDPVRVDVAPSGTPIEAIEQALYPVDESQKAGRMVAPMQAHGDGERRPGFRRTDGKRGA